MQLTVKLPTIFDARLVRHQEPKTIAIHRSLSRDVPEISAAEAPVAFEATIDMVRHDVTLSAEHPLILHRGNKPFSLREYDGRLFRKLLRTSGEDAVDSDPFPFHPHLSPIGKPIRLHHEHRQFALSRGLTYKTWPTFSTYDDARNDTSFESMEHLIKDLNEESFLNCQRMQDRRLDGLICIDGDIWMETSTPCVMVSVANSYNSANPQDVWIKTAFLPEWHDRRITTRYFPLHDTDGMNAYVEELRGMFKGAPAFNVTDLRSYSGTPSSPAMDFDADDEFRHRHLVGLALNYGVCLNVMKMSKDERADHPAALALNYGVCLNVMKMSKDERADHPAALAFDEALRDNFVTGERADMASVAEALLAEVDRRGPLWSSQIISEIGSKRANRLFFEYARRQIDDDEVINIIPTRTPR